MKRKVVISGINIRKAGTLSIYYNLLDEIVCNGLHEKFSFTIMVSDKKLFEKYQGNFEIIDFPKETSSRVMRFYYDYIWMHRYSKKNNIFIWISLNDKTPNVEAKHQYTYCHNSTIFYKCSKMDIKYSKDLFLYTLLYGRLYRHNIEKNDAVIVQQEWIANEFEKRYPVKKMIVMRPVFNALPLATCTDKNRKETVFLYPTAPRTFKNCEALLEAAAILNESDSPGQFKVVLTVKGDENAYARYLYERYGHTENIEFIGFVSRNVLEQLYADSDCLVFPSKLETWGLPMTEFSRYGKTILASDLQYAHETLVGYGNVSFFNPEDAHQLAGLMKKIITGEKSENSTVKIQKYKGEHLESWTDLFNRFL